MSGLPATGDAADDAACAARPGTAFREAFDISVHSDLAAIESLWRGFETGAVATPYQRFDWIAAYGSHLAQSGAFRAVVVRRDTGQVDAILPLVLSRRFGVRLATLPGGKHANFQMPLLSDYAAGWDAGTTRHVVRLTARALGGIDVFVMPSQPVVWHGVANPFAAIDSAAAANRAHAASLTGGAEATFKRTMSNDARKKMRAKIRKLEDVGPLSHVIATTPDEIARVLDAFNAHKTQRFGEMGILNPFESTTMQAFLRTACLPSRPGASAAIDLHALYCGERIAAVIGVAANRLRASGMFISFNPEADLARWSPGDVMVWRTIAHYAERGVGMFDLGLGEARYKETFCDIPEAVRDGAIAVTAAGRIYGALSRAATAAKRRIKADPRLLGAAQKIATRLGRR